MNYDEHFETLDELLTTINDAIQDLVEPGITDPSDPFFSYMFDKDGGVFDDMDMMQDDMDGEDIETGVFTLSPLH